jgi:phosphatidylglycerol:prolipoprotein diacylglycerol transferase
MYPELFRIGGLIFYTHGVLAVLGIIIGSLLIYLLAKKQRLKTDYLFDNIVYSVLAGIVFARVTYFIIYHEQFSNFREIFYLWQGGMVSYGGFIPGFIIFVLLLRAQKAELSKWLSIASIAFPVGLFWGRLGNIFAGEYSGVATTSSFSLGGLVPVPAYEAILLVMISAGLFLMYKKANRMFEKHAFAILTMSYALGRFVIDFWRDENKILFNISLGQMVSLLLFISIVTFSIHKHIQLKRNHKIA